MFLVEKNKLVHFWFVNFPEMTFQRIERVFNFVDCAR